MSLNSELTLGIAFLGMLAIGGFLLAFAVNVQPKSDYDETYKFPRYGEITNYEHDGYKFIIFQDINSLHVVPHPDCSKSARIHRRKGEVE